MHRLLAILLALVPALALGQTISSPRGAPPGADVVIGLRGLTTGASYGLQLRDTRAFGATHALSQFTASDADASLRVRIPATAAQGSQLLELLEVGRGGGLAASRSFGVTAPLALLLEPATAEPGRKVRVSASGLRGGYFRLEYAGAPVLGPVPVDGSTWQGSFVVPRDRPASLPATVKVTGTNTSGRTQLSVRSVSFQAQAPSGLPPFRSLVDVAPPGTVREGTSMSFAGKLVRPDDSGTDGRTSFFWRSADGTQVVPIDGGVFSDPDGNYVPRSARSPSFYMDGAGGGSGSVYGVVSDYDPDTGVRRDTPVLIDNSVAVDVPPPPTHKHFIIRVEGEESPGQYVELQNAYVSVEGPEAQSFLDPALAPPAEESDLWMFHNQLTHTFQNLRGELAIIPVFGCPVGFARGFTDGNGEIDFLFDPDAAGRMQALQATKDLGEIRVIDRGAPIPGIDVHGHQQYTSKLDEGSSVGVYLKVSAGHLGYGETGEVTEDGENCDHPSCPPTVLGYQETFVGLRFEGGDEGQMAVEYGPASLSGMTITVRLPKIPITQAAPQHLRVEGLYRPNTEGVKVRFANMDSFGGSVASSWPDSVFVQSGNTPASRNVGREFRFGWESGFGQVTAARLRILGQTIPFQYTGETVCNLAGVEDFVAPLPDLTRLAVGEPNAPYCVSGSVEVDVRNRSLPARRTFEICTKAPPSHLAPAKVKSVKVDARQSVYRGELKVPAANIPVDDPEMRAHEIPALDNRSKSEAKFNVNHHAEFTGFQQVAADTSHDVASEPTDETGASAGQFGFDDDGNPERLTVLDTGQIPLFRYPWGFSPIAGAIFGADFWLAASLGFYGKMAGNTGTLMDATVDPRVEGGVDVFFDLDVLFGLVSASVTANTHLQVSMKEKIGAGGLPNETYGECFGFDVGVSMEVCAVFCAEDSFPLFSVTEPTPSCRSGAGKASGLAAGYDLPRPQLQPAALAVDGAGQTVVVEVDASNRLVARHIEGNEEVAVHVLRAEAAAVQHTDVAAFGAGQVLAVWSESQHQVADLRALMQEPSAVRNRVDDIARSLVLNWSMFDGTSWSAPQRVTGSLKGVGKPRLSAGRCLSLLHCFRSGRPVYLVWEYERNGNLASPDLEVWGALFTAGSFRGATRLSGTGSSSDMHPTVAWLGSTPVVAWVSSPLPHYGGSTGRRIAYRVVDDPDGGRLQSSPRDAGLAAGAGWPFLSGMTDKLLLAFTVAQDGSVVGNRNALHVATGQCSGTLCTFTGTELRDANGRQFRVERPTIAVDGDGVATLGFRGLAFGPDANGRHGYPTDPLGMLVGTGEFMKVTLPSNLANPVTQVAGQPLSADGLQHWRPQLVFDPAQEAFVGLSRVTSTPAGKHAALEMARAYADRSTKAAAGSKALGNGGLVLHAAAPGPDFRIEGTTLSVPYLTAGDSVPVEVLLRNVGAPYDLAVHGAARVHFAWDAPPGVGVQAAPPVGLFDLATHGTRRVTQQLAVPADHASDRRRTLFVEVRADGAEFDANAADNQAQASTGAMPVPSDLVVLVRTDSPAMLLQWEAVDDPRIAGYRVYKRAENGDFVPYGSSPEKGYADLFAGFRDVEQYRVTSFSHNGIESDLSEIAIGVPKQTTGVFTDGFEPAEE